MCAFPDSSVTTSLVSRVFCLLVFCHFNVCFVYIFEGAQCPCSMIEEQDFIWNAMIENESFPMFVAIVGINESGVRSGGGLTSKTSNELASDKD